MNDVKNTTKLEGPGGLTQTDGQAATSIDYTLQAQNNYTQQVVPSTGERRSKLYSEVVKTQDNKRYKITLKPKKATTTPEQIKSQLKNSINPTVIKDGIKL
jgi:protease II